MADKSRIRRLDSWEKTLICTVRLGKLLNVLPYDINYSTKQLKPSNYRGLLSWYIRLFLYCLDVCYLISAAKHVTLSSVSKDEFVNFYVHLFTRFAAGITGILLAFDRDQLMLLLNLLLRQRRIFQNSWSRRLLTLGLNTTRRYEVSLVFWFKLATALIHVQPIGPLVLHLTNRQSYRYWPSHLGNGELFNSNWFSAAYALNDLIFSYMGIVVCIFVIEIAISYLALSRIWSAILFENVQSRISFQTARKMYIEQVIISRIANSLLSPRFIPAGLIAGGLTLGGIVAALVKTYRRQPPAMLANFTVAVVLFLGMFHYLIEVGGRLWAQSLGTKRHLYIYGSCKAMNREARDLHVRQVRALSECRVYYKDDFYFTPNTYLTYLKTILDWDITLILL